MDNDISFTREGLFRRFRFVVIGWIGLALFAFLYDNGIRSVNDLVNKLSSQNIQAALSHGVVSKISLNLSDGRQITANILEGNISGSSPIGLLTLQTESGEILTANIDLSLINLGNQEFEIEDYSITAIKLAENSVTNEKIEDNSIGGIKIIDGTITGGKLSEGVIVTRHLADNIVTSVKIVDGAVTSSKLLDKVVLTEKLADSAVTEIKLADGSVVTGKIEDLAVTGDKIANATITDIQLSDNSVITDKILDGAITEIKLSDGSVATAKLQNLSVTGDKIANATITDIQLSDNSVITDKILDGAVTEIKLADGSVATAKLQNLSVTGDKIANATITDIQLADGAVITAKVEDGAITEIKLADGSVSLSKLSGLMCLTGEILKKNGSNWECTPDIGSTGFVATVTDGDGITNTGTVTDPILNANTDNVTIEVTSDTIQLKDGGVTSVKIADGTIVNDDVSALAGIEWSKIDKAGSTLADIATRDFSDLLNRLAQYVEITDTGNYFTATDTEGTLQEIGGNYFKNNGNSFGTSAIIGTNDNNSFGIETNGTTKLTVLADGNVGIGTNNPEVLIHGRGSNPAFAVSSSSGGNFAKLMSGSGGSVFYFRNDKYFAIVPTGSVTDVGGAGSTSFYMNGTTGNVGIGTTSPGGKLHIRQTTDGHLSNIIETVVSAGGQSYNNQLILRKRYSDNSNVANATLGSLNFQGNDASGVDLTRASIIGSSDAGNRGHLVFQTHDGTSLATKMKIDYAGNVGIGTTSPGYLLDVIQSSIADKIHINAENTGTLSGTTVRIQAKSSYGTSQLISSRDWAGGAVGTYTNHPFFIMTNGTQKMTVDTSGYVGIGTTSPTSQLHQIYTGTTLPTNGLNYIYWNPGSAASQTADIFTINTSSLGITSGDIFQVQNNGSDLFSVSQSLITSSLPHSFNSPGDVAVAYDINFTNSTASFIKSNATMYLQSGEIFNSSDLVFRTFNSGGLVFDSPGGFFSSQAQTWSLASSAVSALNINSGLLNFDTQNSRLGIGNTTPAALLAVGSTSQFQINSTGAIAAATGITSSGTITFSSLTGCASGLQTDGSGIVSCLPSDISVKNSIEDITTPLEKILGLHGVSYKWNDTGLYGTGTEFGLIAQEVELIAPELVFTMGTGIKGVKYNQLGALLVEAVKAQNTEIENIKASINLDPVSSPLIAEVNLEQEFAKTQFTNFKVKKIEVNEEILASLINVTGEANFFGEVNFNNNVEFRDSIILSKNNAGKITSTAGSDTFEFVFAKPFSATPVLTLSPIGGYLAASNISWWIESVSPSGFILKTGSILVENVEFSWIAVETTENLPFSYPN